MKRSCIGSFRINGDRMRKRIPKDLELLMRLMFVIDVNVDPVDDSHKYFAASDLFDELSFGEKIPEYSVEVEYNPDAKLETEQYKFKVVRIEKTKSNETCNLIDSLIGVQNANKKV